MTRLMIGRPKDWPASEKSAPWTIEQRERVLEALSELPSAIRDTPIKGIFRFVRSKDYPNPGSKVGANIGIYDSAFDPTRNLARIIAHEIAHRIYELLSDKDAIDYRDSTLWKMKAVSRRYVWIPRPSGFVAEDGRSSPDEDFANNIEYLLFEPKKLKQESPQAYDWLRKKYGETFRIRGLSE